ncbi:MAG: hypothetical protein K2F75_00695, partial [Paramuribaculum sp.]|nr:hypothetical protein [Paramuribaculum sp.]
HFRNDNSHCSALKTPDESKWFRFAPRQLEVIITKNEKSCFLDEKYFAVLFYNVNRISKFALSKRKFLKTKAK